MIKCVKNCYGAMEMAESLEIRANDSWVQRPLQKKPSELLAPQTDSYRKGLYEFKKTRLALWDEIGNKLDVGDVPYGTNEYYDLVDKSAKLWKAVFDWVNFVLQFCENFFCLFGIVSGMV